MVCAKMFKKGRGLKIHQTKSGCAAQISNRMKSKSKAASTQDTNHSDACSAEFVTASFGGVESRGKGMEREIISEETSCKTIDCKEKTECKMEDQDAVLEVHISEDVYKEVQELLNEKSSEEKRNYKTENKTDIRNYFKSTEIPKKIQEKEKKQSQSGKENDNNDVIKQRRNDSKRRRDTKLSNADGTAEEHSEERSEPSFTERSREVQLRDITESTMIKVPKSSEKEQLGKPKYNAHEVKDERKVIYNERNKQMRDERKVAYKERNIPKERDERKVIFKERNITRKVRDERKVIYKEGNNRAEKNHDIRNCFKITEEGRKKREEVKVQNKSDNKKVRNHFTAQKENKNYSEDTRVPILDRKVEQGGTERQAPTNERNIEKQDRGVIDLTESQVQETKVEERIMRNKKEAQEDVRIVIFKKVELMRKVEDIQRGEGKEVLSDHGLELTRDDYRSLSGREYLNDKVIDQYIKHIEERNTEETSLPKVYASTTFLYTKLKERGLDIGIEETKDWIKEDLREKEIIFFPVNHQHHWSLIAVEPKKKTVNYLDSIRGSRNSSSAPRIMKAFMESYYRNKGEEVIFRIKIRQDAPLQENSVDCGVFVCQFAERIARRSPLNFRQADLKNAREHMTEELLEGRIHSDWPKKKEDNIGNVRSSSKEAVKLPDKETQDWRSEKSAAKCQKGNKEKIEESDESKQEPPKITDSEQKGDKSRKEKLNWPKGNSPEWRRLDEDLSSCLKILISSPENKAETHPVLIYNISRERFGVKESKKKSKPSGPSKRQRQCKELRGEIKKLKETYKNAPEDQKEAINQLQQEKIKKLRLKKRAESMKKNRKKFSKNCIEFLSQPFDFARNVVAPKPKGEMKSTKEEVEQQLHKAHSDVKKDQEMEVPDDLIEYDEPEVAFNNDVPSWAEFNKHLRKTRSKSAPGPNGVPYIVYKRCPKVARLLWLYLRGMWKKNMISESWRTAEGVFIPKEDGATSVDKFRTISLLNVEGKLYFALRADRLIHYTLANKYIDTSIQKGGVPGISGCMEHTAILSQLIREAKAEKKGLVVTWLDIANAYGSIPHSLIKLALRRAHVPEEFCNLVESYYGNVKIRFTTKNFTTDWQRVEKGIITGCTLSVILFSLSMTMLVMSVKEETKGPETVSGQRQRNSRLQMDDITTTTVNLVQSKYLLDKLMAKLKWADLSAKPEKCRSLVIIKGKVSSKTPYIEGTPITSITEKPVKYLGKVYNKTLNDREQAEEVLEELKQGLRRIQKTKIPGRYKAWIVQHMLLPRLMWPLTIYNIPETRIEEMQRQITACLKRWLGLPKSLSVECFYSRSAKLQLPYSELTEEVKAAKARIHTTFEESDDPCIQGAKVKLDEGRKADTPRRVMEAKSRLQMVEIVGIPNKGKEGLGLNPRKYYSSSSKKEKRSMVVQTVREAEEDRRIVKMTSLAKQGAHTRWEVPQKKLSHKEIISRSETSIKFLVKSVYDLLPTPSNKNIWFGEEETCKLCGGKGTLQHILSGCEVALAQGRYTWRHNEVLREVAQAVEAKRLKHNSQAKPKKTSMNFVKEGELSTTQKRNETTSYLDGASDWKMQADLDGHLKFPKEVAVTDKRPDMILISTESKKVGLVELTVPSEERVEVSGELKKTKYAPLQQEGKTNGWNVQVWTIEVGCKGFPASSMASFLKDLGFAGGERNRTLKKIGEVTENASRRIWGWSHFVTWGK